MFFFATRFFVDFGAPRDHPEPVKTSKTTVVLYENKVSKKSKKRAPELHFGSILDLFWRPVADFSDFLVFFFQTRFLMKKRYTGERRRNRVRFLGPPKKSLSRASG